MISSIISLLLAIFLGMSSVISAQERLRVPEFVPCERNNLTSLTGKVTTYLRGKNKTKFTIKTFAGTTENVALSYKDINELERHYYMNGKALTPHNWSLLEDSPQQIKADVTARVWLCSDQSHKIIVDWQVPTSA
ncbi:hypothetical protein [Alteromonas sp. ASW11-130]|uniref:hypothetical protein n=1 Tax=Alteromonas sp. ASW11-130 TaxID=3015775 RepID=UPI0022421F43|nr:hypothetical protein [Alteromonas sp. ASW11-130]MCW8092842.1 hypothetical protein [Alteromonas sp. ASW11-130]